MFDKKIPKRVDENPHKTVETVESEPDRAFRASWLTAKPADVSTGSENGRPKGNGAKPSRSRPPMGAQTAIESETLRSFFTVVTT